MPILTTFEQSGFIIRGDDYAIAVDPGSYTSAESVAELGRPDATLVSHRHPDHADASILSQLDAHVYTVEDVAIEVLSGTNVKSTVIAEGESFAVAGTPCRVIAMPADHGLTKKQLPENVGFIIETPELTLYYMGDAVTAPISKRGFDVLLIPVGGSGYTFDAEGAAAFVRASGFEGIVVPVHYHNEFSDPLAGDRLKELLVGIADVRVLEVGEELVLVED